MEVDISVENVCKFIIDHGGKVKNTILVSHFKKVLNDSSTKDIARQKFKECVNTVAVVKNENGEKFVQLKKKYRTGDVTSPSSDNASEFFSTQEGSLEQGSKENDSPPVISVSRTSPPQKKQTSPSKEKQQGMTKKSSYSSMSPLAAIVQDQSSRSRDEKDSRSQKSSLSSTDNRAKTDDEASTDFRKRQESPSKPPLAKTVPDRAVNEKEPIKRDSLQVAPDSPAFVAPSAVPLRKKKKENIPPSSNVEQRLTSVDRVKSTLMNMQTESRMSRVRPTSFVPGSYAGSVERARQNFQAKQKLNDDSSSLAPSERSIDSKGEELDDEDDRNIPSFVLDINEKSWIIRSAQGNLVEMRILLDTDASLAEKKDFVMTALHWAAKKGNEEMANMLLDQKVDVNSRSGYTPLHLAAMHGHDHLITLLLENGADAHIRDYSGHKPIHYVKSMSLPLQRIFVGSDSTHQGATKDFVAGLRMRNSAVRKSQNRIGNVISGGLSSVGILMARSYEDDPRHVENEPSIIKTVSTKPSKLGKMKKSKKVKEERPKISVVPIDDSDSGYVTFSGSQTTLTTANSMSSVHLSTPSSPSGRKQSGSRGSLDTSDTY